MDINPLYRSAVIKKEPVFVPATSPAMQNLENVISEIAPTSIPVLLVTEVGAGTQMIVQCLQGLSERSEQSLGTLTCASPYSATFPTGLEIGTEGAQSPNYLIGGHARFSGAN
jgi:DNA-binding NtrC family response regulator